MVVPPKHRPLANLADAITTGFKIFIPYDFLKFVDPLEEYFSRRESKDIGLTEGPDNSHFKHFVRQMRNESSYNVNKKLIPQTYYSLNSRIIPNSYRSHQGVIYEYVQKKYLTVVEVLFLHSSVKNMLTNTLQRLLYDSGLRLFWFNYRESRIVRSAKITPNSGY